MALLAIDDDAATLRWLVAALAAEGLEVETADDGEAGLAAARAGGHDLIVLDVMLPRRDGFAVMDSIRQLGITTPVIFISARGEAEDRRRGLHHGAEDFLGKPFAPAELAARVRAVLRRTTGARQAPHQNQAAGDTLRFDELEVDLGRRRATRAGRALHLTPKELAILSLLLRQTGEVLTRRFIAAQLWDRSVDSRTNLIDVHVRRLRSKMDDPYERRLLHTVRGVGYVLAQQPPG